MSESYRIAHISDLHIWRFTWNPLLWVGKRSLGLGNLALRRARKFRRRRVPRLLSALEGDGVDHLVVSGDLTTTSLPSEFTESKEALASWLDTPERSTILPGNHDRYTRSAHRKRLFEQHFREFCEGGEYPFLKPLAPGLDLIGFDPNIPRPLSARGLVKNEDLKRLKKLLQENRDRGTKALVFVCHYPGQIPGAYAEYAKGHELVGGHQLVQTFSEIDIPIYWLHGHIHYPWRHQSPNVPNLIYLNPGAPLMRVGTGISLARWILTWDGERMETEWRSAPEAAGLLLDTVDG